MDPCPAANRYCTHHSPPEASACKLHARRPCSLKRAHTHPATFACAPETHDMPPATHAAGAAASLRQRPHQDPMRSQSLPATNAVWTTSTSAHKNTGWAQSTFRPRARSWLAACAPESELCLHPIVQPAVAVSTVKRRASTHFCTSHHRVRYCFNAEWQREVETRLHQQQRLQQGLPLQDSTSSNSPHPALSRRSPAPAP